VHRRLSFCQGKQKDLEDIPKKIQKDIEFHFVDRMLDISDGVEK